MNYIDYNYPYAQLCGFEYISEKITKFFGMKYDDLLIFRDSLELNYVPFKVDYTIIDELKKIFPLYNSRVCKTVIEMENYMDKSIQTAINIYNKQVFLEKEEKKLLRKELRLQLRTEKIKQKELEKIERKLIRDKLREEKNKQKELKKKKRKLLYDKLDNEKIK